MAKKTTNRSLGFDRRFGAKQEKQIGYIYIMSNPAFRYLKIGSTSIDPETRRRHLSQSTSVPCDFVLEYSALVSDIKKYEAKVHGELSSKRVDKEFFDLTIDEAKQVCDSVLKKLPSIFAPRSPAFRITQKHVDIDFGINIEGMLSNS